MAKICEVCKNKRCKCTDVCQCKPNSDCYNNNACILKDCCQIFKIMSDETRLKILVKLLNGDQCVCELESGLNVSQSCVSHQLKVLKDAGLVECSKSGNRVTYKLKDDHVHKLLSICLEHVKEL